jgi:hypothetical protein
MEGIGMKNAPENTAWQRAQMILVSEPFVEDLA